MKFFSLLFLVFLTACAAPNRGPVALDLTSFLSSIDPNQQSQFSEDLHASAKFCAQGKCEQTPFIGIFFEPRETQSHAQTISTGKQFEQKNYLMKGIVTFDHRAGQDQIRYIHYKNVTDTFSCYGYYSYTGARGISDSYLRCLGDPDLFVGKLRTVAQTRSGLRAETKIGTGAFAYRGGGMVIIYGLDTTDVEQSDFLALWAEFGGVIGELPFATEPPAEARPKQRI